MANITKMFAEALPSVKELIPNNLKSADEMTYADQLNLRAYALECATRMSIAAGKPGHARYIAFDVYNFLLFGTRPPGPPRREEPTADDQASDTEHQTSQGE